MEKEAKLVGVLRATGGSEAKAKKEWEKMQKKMEREDKARKELQVKQNEAKAVCFGGFGKMKNAYDKRFANRYMAFDRKFMKQCMNCSERTMCQAFSLGVEALNIQSNKR